MKACCHLLYLIFTWTDVPRSLLWFSFISNTHKLSQIIIYNLYHFVFTDKFRKAFWMNIKQHHRLNFIKERKLQSALNHQCNKVQQYHRHKTKRTWLKWKMTSTPRHFFCHYWQLKRFVKSKACRFINNFLPLKRYHLIKCFNFFSYDKSDKFSCNHCRFQLTFCLYFSNVFYKVSTHWTKFCVNIISQKLIFLDFNKNQSFEIIIYGKSPSLI